MKRETRKRNLNHLKDTVEWAAEKGSSVRTPLYLMGRDWKRIARGLATDAEVKRLRRTIEKAKTKLLAGRTKDDPVAADCVREVFALFAALKPQVTRERKRR